MSWSGSFGRSCRAQKLLCRSEEYEDDSGSGQHGSYYVGEDDPPNLRTGSTGRIRYQDKKQHLTPVASKITSESPPTDRAPRCTKCQALGILSSEEYWHIGETKTRFLNSTPRIFKGENNSLKTSPSKLF